MSYHIKIVRANSDLEWWREDSDELLSPITLEEWLSAVEETANVRLAIGDQSFRHPRTGTVHSVPNSGGDVEFYFADEDRWARVFWWSPQGYISFPGSVRLETADDPYAMAARQLARFLGARLIGDCGETYDG
jgi:hypothetical protein